MESAPLTLSDSVPSFQTRVIGSAGVWMLFFSMFTVDRIAVRLESMLGASKFKEDLILPASRVAITFEMIFEIAWWAILVVLIGSYWFFLSKSYRRILKANAIIAVLIPIMMLGIVKIYFTQMNHINAVYRILYSM